MEKEEKETEVQGVEAEDDTIELEKVIYARLMKRFEAMGDEAKAMLRLYDLCMTLGGIITHTAAEDVAQTLKVPVKADDPAYGDAWIAGFSDCLEMVIARHP